MGLTCWFDPSFLKPIDPTEIVEMEFEDGTKEPVTLEQLQTAYSEYSGLFQILNDIETGLVHFSFSEYRALPSNLLQLRRLYNHYSSLKKDKSKEWHKKSK